MSIHPPDAVPCRLVVTSLTQYRAAIVDIRPRRSVHCVDALPCLVLNPHPLGSGQVDCRAVHYGLCVPLVLDFNPVNLLTTDLESDLHRLVNQFVAADRAAHLLVNQKEKNLSNLNSSMLALATSASSTSSTSSSPTPRPLASSSILSAVEKFERKSLQARNIVPVRVKRDSSPVGKEVGQVSTKPEVVKIKDAKDTVTTTAAKYDSCTWPSFKRPTPSVPDGTRIVVVGKGASEEGKKKEEMVEEKKKEVGGENINKNVVVGEKKSVVKEEKQTKNEKRGEKGSTKKKVRISDKKNLILSSKDEEIKLTNGENGKLKHQVECKKENVQEKKKTSNKNPPDGDMLAKELDKILVENSNKVQISEQKSGSVDSGIGSESSPPSPSPLKEVEFNSSDAKTFKYSDQLITSPVDFAKKRFQRTSDVNESKTKFENPSQKTENSCRQNYKQEWLPSPAILSVGAIGDPVAEANLVQSTVEVLKRDQRQQRVNQRKASSPEPTLPHPKLTFTQKQHIRERSLSPTGGSNGAHVPIRPFLTKGSVAERVLIFERCPTNVVDREIIRDKVVSKHQVNANCVPEVVSTSQQSSHKDADRHSTSPTTRNLHRLNNKSSPQAVQIPHFHFPNGRPILAKETDAILQRVAAAFANLENGRATREQFGVIAKACDVPLYWKVPLFIAAGGEKKDYLSCEGFLEFWKRILSTCHDEASKFVRILSKGNRNYLLPEDFTPIIQDVVNTHPGLTFLKEAREFHSRYVHTVIARIYYCVNRSWTGRITAPELRKSNFLQVVAYLEEEDDINQITEYFSYEHFYVIYCKFWELDKDHDLYIDKTDLSRHNEHAIASRMIDRIFSGAVTRGRAQKEQKMSYTEFVWFLISEEDKRHPTSIEYWFRCMDLDGDGYLSMYELEYFYEEQLNRMEALGIETLPFKDCLCQMLDMIRPKNRDLISLSDLKRCRMTSIFFDTFFNLEKYLDHEQRDPFASQRDHDIEGGAEMSDWDRYAAEEYEFLVAEEGANDQQEDPVYEDDEDELSSNFEKLALSAVDNRRGNNLMLEEDYADYADYTESDDYQY